MLWRIHPWEVLREEFLKPMKMTAYEPARLLRVPAPQLHDSVSGRRGMVADTAARRARFFGTSEEFWMNLRAAYENRQARTQPAGDLRRIQPRRRRGGA